MRFCKFLLGGVKLSFYQKATINHLRKWSLATDEIVEIFDSSLGEGESKRTAVLKLGYSVSIIVQSLTLQSSSTGVNTQYKTRFIQSPSKVRLGSRLRVHCTCIYTATAMINEDHIIHLIAFTLLLSGTSRAISTSWLAIHGY